jgi:hypothetical protein
MNAAKTLLLATCLLGLVVAATPTANAAIAACGDILPAGTGPIGQTLDYVDGTQQYACVSTISYAYAMCRYVFAPNICLVIL